MTSALTGEHFYVTSHTLYYNTKEPIPIAEVVSALQGLEYVLRSVPGVLARITDTRIAEAEFFVERIESGSLTETVLIKLFFQDEEEFKKFLDKIREKPMLRNTIVGVAIGGLLTYGAMWAASNTGRTAANITANNNVIINVGAGQVGLTEQGLKSIIESSVRSNSELAKNAVRVIAPAKREAGTSLTISGEDSSTIVIGPEAVAETPEKINPPADSSIEHLKGVDVALRAYDLDNKKNGWAGKIEGRTPRVKIELHPLVDETALFGKASINADVIIVHKLKSGAKSMTPEKIIIEKLN